MKRKTTFGMMVFALVFALGTSAQAVPSLGVGTGTIDCTGASDYWQCFSGNSASGSGHGFELPASGAANGVTVWSNLTGVNIWLLGEPGIGDFSFKVGTTTLNSAPVSLNEPVDGYKGSFKGLNLGQVDGAFTWFDLPSPFSRGEQGLTGTLTYNGEATGSWLFIVADLGLTYNGSNVPFNFGGNRNHDEFSPKTTSAYGVSEPGAVLLFASGLVGLVGYRRKKRME